MKEFSVNTKQEHVVWLDVLRFVAIFMVIACHCTDPFNVSVMGRGDEAYSFWGSFYGSFLRPCVPLFVMISGLLLLPIRQSMSGFYKKRIPRVLVPFLIWSVIYNLFPWISQAWGATPEFVSGFFAYAAESSASFSSAWHDIMLIPFNFSVYTTHLWYVYMLIGLYLYLPIFSAWVEKASNRAKLFFLVVWGITLLMPYVNRFVAENLWGACAWNQFGMLYAFAGFSGYLLLGHYLGKNNSLSLFKTLLIAVPMFTIGYAITFIGFSEMKALPGATEMDIELFFTYCSLNVVLMSAAVFITIQKVRISSPTVCCLLANLTKCGFGIYMVHYFFVGLGFSIASSLSIPVGLIVPFAAVIAFSLAWLFVAMLYRLPGTKWLLG